MKLVLALTVLLGLAAITTADNYAVLVAGSNGYYNYRHQADICHAFHILSDKGGFPAENIIVMMYDDIAYSQSNPFPGNLINKPNGTNVYPGVNKDYVKDAVTPQNFLNVLSGKAEAMTGVGSGKVLKTTADDNIFVYFSDHGAPGLIAFPAGGYLYAKDLLATIKEMHSDNKYAKMVLYVEACESGSMFDGLLPEDINVFATTAANPSESSYAWYYDSKRGTYLGDEYSIQWMEDSDAADLTSKTLQQQFDFLVTSVTKSHPQQYGDKSLGSLTLDKFQSYHGANMFGVPTRKSTPVPTNFATNCRDCKLDILTRRFADAETAEDRARFGELLKHEIKSRANMDQLMSSVVSRIAPAPQHDAMMFSYSAPRDFDCLKKFMTVFESKCGKFDDYGLKYVRTLVNLCENNVPLDKFANVVRNACPFH